jgi:hypothetical protein
MRKITAFAAALAVALSLAACTDSQVTQVQDYAKAICGIVPAAADIATIHGVPGAPVGKVLAQIICDQWIAKRSTMSLVDDGCLAVVAGVCVREEKAGE